MCHSFFYDCPKCKGKGKVKLLSKMTTNDLIKLFDGYQGISPTAKIRYNNSIGLVVQLGESLSEKWRSGDIIVFWADGECTALPEESFNLLEFDLFQVEK
jgi:hypothetical protein